MQTEASFVEGHGADSLGHGRTGNGPEEEFETKSRDEEAEKSPPLNWRSITSPKTSPDQPPLSIRKSRFYFLIERLFLFASRASNSAAVGSGAPKVHVLIGRRVVTGMGMLSPLGHTVEDTWQAIFWQARAAMAPSRVLTCRLQHPLQRSVKNFDISFTCRRRTRAKWTCSSSLAWRQASSHGTAALEITEETAPRVGCAIGSGIGGIGQIEKNADLIKTSGRARYRHFLSPAPSST